MTKPAGYAPLAAQALQRLGYYVHESWVKKAKKEEEEPLTEKLMIKLLTETAKLPTRGSPESIGYDVYLDDTEVQVEPGKMALLKTGIAARPPDNTYIRIAPRSGLTVKRSLHTLAGVVDPDYTGNITVVIHNFGLETQTFKRGDKIAQLIMENATTPTLEKVDDLNPTARGTSGFGSTDGPENPEPIDHTPVIDPVVHTHEIPGERGPPDKESIKSKLTNDLNLIYQMPYDIGLSDTPFDNQTF